MPNYDFECKVCGQVFEEYCEYEKRHEVKCKCGGATIKLFTMRNGFDPFTPYWSENIDKHPVLIESRSHRSKLMKEKNLDIMPYKHIPTQQHVRGKDGHLMTYHEIDKMKKDIFSKQKIR